MQTLAFAKSRGWRTEPVPLAKEITDGLAKQPKSQGFRAMPYKALPAFMASEIDKDDSPARLALLFTILTAARSGEARKATWAEIDLEDRLWRRPADHMKSRKAHDVPLCDAALSILARAKALKDKSGLIFPNSRGKALSDAALGKMLALAGCGDTVHGFRSTFRDWAAEKMPTVPYIVAELALAHETGDATERAYLRSDLLDMRRALMAAWGQFAAPSLSGDSGNVTPISAASAA
jgi:integrase